jgi:hypothetical protein
MMLSRVRAGHQVLTPILDVPEWAAIFQSEPCNA